jgi:ABC-type phosphate/phosphonate transport system substrate-binding protein
VDADLATICLKCLEKDPARRYGTALALAEDLERWLHHEPIEARPVGNAGRFWRWCRREPRLAGMAGGLIILLSATTFLALALYYRGQDQLAAATEEAERQDKLFFARIENDWNLGGRPAVRVYAAELARRARRPFLVEGNEVVVVLGVHQPRQAPDPLQILQRFSLLANCLQTNTAYQADSPLLFDLNIYPTYSNALAGLSARESDLMLLTPASYVRHRALHQEIQPLAHFAGGRTLRTAIFSRLESGIRRLDELKGKSLGFASLDLPLVEDYIKAELWTAGLRAQDLSRIEILSRGVISAVQAGRIDVGVADLNEVVRLTNAGVRLHIIREADTPGYLWVSTGKLPATTVHAIRSRLVGTRDPEVLAALDGELTGFKPASAGDFDEVEQSLERAKLFDGKE